MHAGSPPDAAPEAVNRVQLISLVSGLPRTPGGT